MIPTLQFGSTGHKSTRTIFGAAAFWDTPQKDVDTTMDLVLENGVNHVDTALAMGALRNCSATGFAEMAGPSS